MKNYSTRIEYDRLLAKAYNNFKYFQWEAAIANYEKALVLFPNESFPKAQIAECRARLADKPAKPEPKPELKPEPKPEPKPDVSPEPVLQPVLPQPDPLPQPILPDPVVQVPVLPEDPMEIAPETALALDSVATDMPLLDSLPIVPPFEAPILDSLPEEPVLVIEQDEPDILDGSTASLDDDHARKVAELYNGSKFAPVRRPHLNEELLARYAAVQKQMTDDEAFHRNKRNRYAKYAQRKDNKQGLATKPIHRRSYPKISKPTAPIAEKKQLVDTKTWKQGNKEITQLTYKADERTYIYKKVIQQGGNYYSKDQRAITPEAWETETGTSRY